MYKSEAFQDIPVKRLISEETWNCGGNIKDEKAEKIVLSNLG